MWKLLGMMSTTGLMLCWHCRTQTGTQMCHLIQQVTFKLYCDSKCVHELRLVRIWKTTGWWRWKSCRSPACEWRHTVVQYHPWSGTLCWYKKKKKKKQRSEQSVPSTQTVCDVHNEKSVLLSARYQNTSGHVVGGDTPEVEAVHCYIQRWAKTIQKSGEGEFNTEQVRNAMHLFSDDAWLSLLSRVQVYGVDLFGLHNGQHFILFKGWGVPTWRSSGPKINLRKCKKVKYILHKMM